MRVRFALIAEGSSEKPLVKILEALCLQSEFTEVEGIWANESLELLEPGKVLADQVRALLELDPAIDLLFIHRDADARSADARREEIDEGMAASGFVTPYVPLVPIQETEAWLLLDEGEIRRVVGNPGGKQNLHLPKPSQVEQRAQPKQLLRSALQLASKPGSRNQIDDRRFGRLRRDLLQNLDIEGPIRQLTAWQWTVDVIHSVFVVLVLTRNP